MTETKARFCDVCNKMVDKEQTVYGKLEWKSKYYSNYWQSEIDNKIVCASCWEPLWEMLGELGERSLAELVAWMTNPDGEDKESAL